jgi:biopolymer transport protein ExbD
MTQLLVNPPKSRPALISLTPLIDVVFILLVFFMLTSQFHRWHIYELANTNLSEGNGTGHSLHLVMSKDSYRLGPNTYADEFIIARTKLAMKKHKELIIQPSKQLPLQNLINLMDQLDQAGMKKYRLAVHTKDNK